MQNPPHPGEFIRDISLEPNGITDRPLAAKLGFAPSTLHRVLQGNGGISPQMALRLSKAPGRTPESWLIMQHNHDLWQARRTVNFDSVERVDFCAAKPRVNATMRRINTQDLQP